MASGLTLAGKGKKVPLKNTWISLQYTVLVGVTMSGEELTPLVAFKGKLDERIAMNSGGMLASRMQDACQEEWWTTK
jgi:hypothetical protein